MSYDIIKQKLSAGEPVLLDGGLGTEVLRRGVRWRQHGIKDAPNTIKAIHADYLESGVDVMTSHTFNLTKRNFINFFRDMEHMSLIGAPDLEGKAEELCQKAVALAKEARTDVGKTDTVALAGSISPVMHLFRPDLSPDYELCREHHSECVGVLVDAGVDFIFFEGFNNTREIKAALKSASAYSLPVWISLVPDMQGNLLNGEAMKDAADIAMGNGADAVLISAGSPDMINQGLPNIINGAPAGAKAIVGRYSPPSWKPDFYPRFVDTDEISPAQYAQMAKGWLELGAGIVGGSSGTTPEHIRAVRKVLG